MVVLELYLDGINVASRLGDTMDKREHVVQQWSFDFRRHGGLVEIRIVDVEYSHDTGHAVLVDYKGETKKLTEWCAQLRLPYNQIHARLFQLNWIPKKAFETPIRYRKLKDHIQD